MERHSLLFRIKPSTEAHVADVLAGYESPATVIDDETRLLRTTVFMHGDVVVRTMDIEGSLQKVAAHLSRQPQIQATEQALNSSLAEPRDLSDPAAAGAFFRRAMMQRIVDRRIPVEGGADGPAVTRHALLYPLRPGTGEAADAVFQAGGDPPPQAGATRLQSTTVFRHGDTVVRMFEITGDLGEAFGHLVRAAALRSAGRGLAEFLDGGIELTSEDGLRSFFHRQLMSVVTDRRAMQVA
jgi:hypothetical protein